MASRSNRTSPPAPSSPPPPASQPSKLPKFLQKGKSHREAGSNASIASSSSGGSLEREDNHGSNNINREKSRKSRLGGFREPKGEEKLPRPITTTAPPNTELAFPTENDEGETDDPPVIIEPAPRPTPLNPFPRPRTRSERPISEAAPSPGLYASPSSGGSRIGDLPTRLSGWFSHTFSSSSTDLSLATLLAQQQQQQQSLSASSPTKAAGLRPNALLTAARTGSRHLDKAVRYLLDSDTVPDRCTDSIWLLGVKHPGYEPPAPLPPGPGIPGKRRSSVSVDSDIGSTTHERGSGFGIGRRVPSAFTYRTPGPISNSEHSLSLSQSQPPSSSSTITPSPNSPNPNPAANWPPAFYSDFTSRIWVTYRNQFMPIRDTSLQMLMQEPLIPILQEGDQKGTGINKGRWAWVPGVGEKVWTSDSGWGCMLRTGQSLLANALMGLYLGRDYRPPHQPQSTASYATYVKLLTYFFDSPSPLAPFSVHRMALAGKELGTDVGCWFGPSIAAGAIKTLVHSFPEAGLGVSIAVDGSIYQSDVFSASSPIIGSPASGSRHRRGRGERRWVGRAVLVLVGIRLGIDGVNPVYYETIKALYTFPQSVGIAGGRPSSSYYFVGNQADNLFYLDPHHARPTIPLRPPPSVTKGRETPEQDRRDQRHQRMATSPARTSTIKPNSPPTPSPLAYSYSTTSNSTTSSSSLPLSSPHTPSPHPRLSEDEEHYVNAYASAELRTFHCERVRKMPLSGLDPSMLLGFLCKDESDWEDFRRRVGELGKKYKTIFTVQDEPPSWPSDSDEFMGLESMSEPDDMDLHPSDEEEDSEPFFDDAASKGHSRETKSSDFDTEEDAVGPITPGPGSRTTFDMPKVPGKGRKEEDGFEPDELDGDEEEEDDDDDSWVDPSVPTSPDVRSPDRLSATPMTLSKSNGSTSSGGSGTSRSKKSNTKKAREKEPPTHYPFPSSLEDTPGITTREENGNSVRMHTARARDGGRTQSGGVKGVLTTDDG